MLLDTSGLLCLYDRRERRQGDAVIHYRAATRRATHEAVLTEFVALAQARGAPRDGALALVDGLLDDPAIEIFWIDERLLREAVSLLQARTDKSYSLCDAVSFVLMRQERIIEALTTDHHFEQEGFVRLLR